MRGAKKGRYTMSIHVLVPPGRLTFLPAEGGDTARLSLLVTSLDARDGKVTSVKKTILLDRPPQPGEDFDLVVDLDLGEGKHVVAVGLRDEASRVTSILATTLTLGG